MLNCYTKSIGKFPKKVAHASFLQCSAYIVYGQDDWLRKINLKFLWNQSEKNQVKHGKYGSIMLPNIKGGGGIIQISQKEKRF